MLRVATLVTLASAAAADNNMQRQLDEVEAAGYAAPPVGGPGPMPYGPSVGSPMPGYGASSFDFSGTNVLFPDYNKPHYCEFDNFFYREECDEYRSRHRFGRFGRFNRFVSSTHR
jgi:hypothetical protein